MVDAAFVTHFGYFEETFEDWWAQQQADDTWDPSLGLVAEVDGKIVGYSNNGVIDGTGYVFELGVAPAAPGTGDRQGPAPAFLRELRGAWYPHRALGRRHGERHRGRSSSTDRSG